MADPTTTTSKPETSKSLIQQKIKYPKHVFFIIATEFCERFSFLGIRTVLPLYFTDRLLLSEHTSTFIFHLCTGVIYVLPVFGAMIADTWLGKFKTITYISIIYVAGSVILALSTTPQLKFPELAFTMIALLFIAIGTGGIKPCVPSFGGDQYIIPGQEHQLSQFFSILYFSINCGSLLSTFITPLLRDTPCFGSKNCFTFAFGLPAMLMLIALVIFVSGKRLYIIKPPGGNMIIKVFKTIGNAISTKRKNKGVKKPHWLDYAEEKYGIKLVKDTKSLLSVLLMFVPIPAFWALYDQQPTTWTFLARRMNGNIGFYYILPDQMQMINPILTLIFIPLFEYGFYPLLNKMHLLQTQLKRMTTGGIISATAFVISGCVALAVEAREPIVAEAGFGHLNFYNNLNCPVTILSNIIPLTTSVTISEHKFKQFILKFERSKEIDYTISGTCINNSYKGTFKLEEQKEIGYYFFDDRNVLKFTDSLQRNIAGQPSLRFLLKNNTSIKRNYNIIVFNQYKEKMFSIKATNISIQNVYKPGKYKINIGKKFSQEIELRMGGVYAIMGEIDSKKLYLEITTEPNNIHMLTLIPQYVVMTVGEVLLSVTALQFAYSQAPQTMKAVIFAGWLLTTAFGNLLVVFIGAFGPFPKTSYRLFFFAALLYIAMLIFAFLAKRYKYVDPNEDDMIDNKGVEEKKET